MEPNLALNTELHCMLKYIFTHQTEDDKEKILERNGTNFKDADKNKVHNVNCWAHSNCESHYSTGVLVISYHFSLSVNITPNLLTNQLFNG